LTNIIPLVDISNTAYRNNKRFLAKDVADDHAYTYVARNMNFNKDLGLKGKYCYHPFNTITVDGFGDVYVCICQAWLPVSVGKIWDFESLNDIVRSHRAREIQSSIIDGSYRYCDNNTCSIIQENELKVEIGHRPDTVNWINFAIDASCNLTCPSCRQDFKYISEGPELERRMRIVDHIAKLIEKHNHWIKFTLSGDGDPFASLIYRHLLTKLNLKDNNNVEIEIVTNGILAKAHWHKMQGIYRNIVRFKISFDAGSEAVYNITRRGGDWNKLLDSAEYINKWKQKNYSQMVTTANFVVQTANYKDMAEYVELCDRLGFDEINFQKIVDWGTFTNFSEQAVWQSNHPEYNNFLQELQHPSLNNKKVNFTNLTTIRNETK
jgi:organic radical activating enzyme